MWVSRFFFYNSAGFMQNAIESYQKLLGDQTVAREIAQLWQEYEDASTPEALLVKDLDKFEMIVQALEYEKCTYTASGCLFKKQVAILILYCTLYFLNRYS